jgi:hypothetical protein
MSDNPPPTINQCRLLGICHSAVNIVRQPTTLIGIAVVFGATGLSYFGYIPSGVAAILDTACLPLIGINDHTADYAKVLADIATRSPTLTLDVERAVTDATASAPATTTTTTTATITPAAATEKPTP